MKTKQLKKCETHRIHFDLVGHDKFCELNCLICCDCLKTLDHQHKYEGINHKTITIQQLRTVFEKIINFSKQQINSCKDKLEEYFNKFYEELKRQIDKEKKRLQEMIENIVLTQISKDKQELQILQHLYHERYQELICKEVELVAKKLCAFVPKKLSPGFNIFKSVLKSRGQVMGNEVREMIKNPHYDNITLKDAIPATTYPHFNDPIRVKTEQPRRPIRTPPRKVVKKTQDPPPSPQKSLLDLKDFHVKIKKPLQFPGSEIIKPKQDIGFIEKMFPMRVYATKLLYRASQNNYSVKAFHQLCDGQLNTIVFVKTQFNKVIGGFTPMPWKSTNNTIHSDIKKQSFLFSLSLKQKMKLVDEKSAIFNSMNFGPTFGGGADLAICHNCNVEKTSYSQFPFSYANNRYLENNQHSTFLFTGQQNGNHFLIKQWEVWKLDLNE